MWFLVCSFLQAVAETETGESGHGAGVDVLQPRSKTAAEREEEEREYIEWLRGGEAANVSQQDTRDMVGPPLCCWSHSHVFLYMMVWE